MPSQRELTEGEQAILRMIQEGYGPQNTVDHVFFSDRDEAVIFVRDAGGKSPLMVVLTNLARDRAEGIISSDAELKKYLRLK